MRRRLSRLGALLVVFTWLLCAATSVQADDPVNAGVRDAQHDAQVKLAGSYNAPSGSDSIREGQFCVVLTVYAVS